MYQNDAEVLFPPRVIASLRFLRGDAWRRLVEHVMVRPENDPDVLAFTLMMIRIDGCLTCHADSYRALRGCTACARQSINRFKGTDDDLVAMWELARAEIIRWLELGVPPRME